METGWLGSAGAVGTISIAGAGLGPDGGSLVVTPVADAGGRLKLIVWDFDGDALARRGDGGPSTSIAVDAVACCGSPSDTGLLVTAVRDAGSRKLRLLFWSLVKGKGGKLRPVVSYEAAGAGKQSVARVAVSRCAAGVVTAALRSSDHRLSLDVWDYVEFSPTGHGLGPHRLGGVLTDVRGTELAVAQWAGGIVTAVRDPATCELQLQAWAVATDGTVTKKGTAAALAIDDVAMTALSDRRLVTVARMSDGGELVALVWDVGPRGAITRRGSTMAPAPAQIAMGLGVCNLGQDVLIDTVVAPGQIAAVARQADTNRLKVVLWDIDPSGELTLRGHDAFDPIDAFAATFARLGTRTTTAGELTPKAQALVAARRSNGKLGVFEFGVANDDVVPFIPAWGSIDFTMQHQLHSKWCWAATSTSVAHFYKPSSGWTQCKVANRIKGRSDCCGKGAAGPCNQPDHLEHALEIVGHLREQTDGPTLFGDVAAATAAGHPLCARIAWSGGGAHFMTLVGYDGSEGRHLTIADPIFGVSVYDYDEYRDAYRHTGTWTDSYATQRQGV
jgi:hypothetical protein